MYLLPYFVFRFKKIVDLLKIEKIDKFKKTGNI